MEDAAVSVGGYIGVDVGTSACKAILLGGGSVRHVATAGYPTRRRIDGEVTQDPRDWLKAVRATMRECTLAASAAGVHVHGVGVTAPAHVAVLTGADGEPLARALLSFDGRPASVVPALRARYGRALADSTFVELSAAWTLPQLVWLRSAAPSIWPQIRWMLTQKDWIRFRLTGVPLIDASDAAGTAMVDQRSQCWIEAACEDAGLRPDQLPDIVGSTAPGGRLTREWARATGLAAGTPVVVGATDTAAELVSVGAIAPGASLVKIASTGTVVAVSAHPVPDPRLLTYAHAVPGLWYTLAATNSAAVAYQWLRETMFAARPEFPPVAYAEIDLLASSVPAGAGGVLFLPFLNGERTPSWDPRLRGAFLGLSSGHGRAHLARSVLEGVAFALRSGRDAVVDAGLEVERPYLAGGGTASKLWRAILVSALGEPGRLSEPQGPAVGAAVLAAATGATTPEHVRQALPRRHTTMVAPQPRWVSVYDDMYAAYLRAAEAVADVSHDLARTAEASPVHRRSLDR